MTTKADFDLGCSDGCCRGQLGAEVVEVQSTLASVSMLAPGLRSTASSYLLLMLFAPLHISFGISSVDSSNESK